MRSIKPLMMFALLVLMVPLTAFGQDNNSQTLETEDGWNLEISYYNKALQQNTSGIGVTTPVVVLLPGDKGNRFNWEGSGGFAQLLYQQGYAVVTVDVRKYGKSTPPAGAKKVLKKLVARDYGDIVQFDLEAVKQFLFDEHQKKRLNMAKMAIIAPESMAPIATAYAVRDWKKIPYKDAATIEHRTPRGQDVKALVLISPTMNLGGFPGNRAIQEIKNPKIEVAICLCTGGNDAQGLKQANKMYRLLTGREKADSDTPTMYYNETFPGLGQRGTELLKRNNSVMESTIILFLNEHLGQLNVEWRDRRTRYEQNR